MRTIIVEAVPRDGIKYTCTPGRFWPCGEQMTVQVLDQDEDGPPIEQEFHDRELGRMVKKPVPDMTRIGRRTYAELEANRFIRILSDEGATAGVSAAAIEAARTQVGELAKQLTDATVKAAAAVEENSRLKARVAELEESLRMALLPGPGAKDSGPKKTKQQTA